MTLANEITDAFRYYKTFTSRDIRMVLKSSHKQISDKTIQVSISRMVKKNRVYPITKGIFSLEKRDDFAGFAFAPFYYGGLAALMIMDMIDDQVRMEIMTTRRVKRSFISIYGGSGKVVLHHIPKKYYFGFRDVRYGDITVPVSDPEKTLIDLFYYRERLSLQDYSEILKGIRLKVLNGYLKSYNTRLKRSVLKFVNTYRPLANSGKLENKY